MISEELKLIVDKFNEQGKMNFLEETTEDKISEFEKEHSVKLPEKYKEWLLFSDGGELFLPAGIQLYGIEHKPVIEYITMTDLVKIISSSVHLHQETLFSVKKLVKKSLFIIRKLEELKMMKSMMISSHS